MGACGGVTNLFMESFPNRPALVGGVLGEECRAVLSDFFKGLRENTGGNCQGKLEDP
jgi:tRNA(adenine34) deaminase